MTKNQDLHRKSTHTASGPLALQQTCVSHTGFPTRPSRIYQLTLPSPPQLFSFSCSRPHKSTHLMMLSPTYCPSLAPHVHFHTDFLTEYAKPNKIACIWGLCRQISTQVPSAAPISLHSCSACDPRAEPKGLTGWSWSNKWHSCSDEVPGCLSSSFQQCFYSFSASL